MTKGPDEIHWDVERAFLNSRISRVVCCWGCRLPFSAFSLHLGCQGWVGVCRRLKQPCGSSVTSCMQHKSQLLSRERTLPVHGFQSSALGLRVRPLLSSYSDFGPPPPSLLHDRWVICTSILASEAAVGATGRCGSVGVCPRPFDPSGLRVCCVERSRESKPRTACCCFP